MCVEAPEACTCTAYGYVVIPGDDCVQTSPTNCCTFAPGFVVQIVQTPAILGGTSNDVINEAEPADWADRSVVIVCKAWRYITGADRDAMYMTIASI